MNTKICQWRCENVSRVSIFAKFGNRLSIFVKIICAIEKFVVPLHPISRQTKMATETIASLAQLVEHSICNQAVVGSSPTRGSLPPQQSGRTDCTTRNEAIDASAFKTKTFCVVFVLERRGEKRWRKGVH